MGEENNNKVRVTIDRRSCTWCSGERVYNEKNRCQLCGIMACDHCFDNIYRECPLCGKVVCSNCRYDHSMICKECREKGLSREDIDQIEILEDFGNYEEALARFHLLLMVHYDNPELVNMFISFLKRAELSSKAKNTIDMINESYKAGITGNHIATKALRVYQEFIQSLWSELNENESAYNGYKNILTVYYQDPELLKNFDNFIKKSGCNDKDNIIGTIHDSFKKDLIEDPLNDKLWSLYYEFVDRFGLYKHMYEYLNDRALERNSYVHAYLSVYFLKHEKNIEKAKKFYDRAVSLWQRNKSLPVQSPHEVEKEEREREQERERARERELERLREEERELERLQEKERPRKVIYSIIIILILAAIPVLWKYLGITWSNIQSQGDWYMTINTLIYLFIIPLVNIFLLGAIMSIHFYAPNSVLDEWGNYLLLSSCSLVFQFLVFAFLLEMYFESMTYWSTLIYLFVNLFISFLVALYVKYLIVIDFEWDDDEFRNIVLPLIIASGAGTFSSLSFFNMTNMFLILLYNAFFILVVMFIFRCIYMCKEYGSIASHVFDIDDYLDIFKAFSIYSVISMAVIMTIYGFIDVPSGEAGLLLKLVFAFVYHYAAVLILAASKDFLRDIDHDLFS